MATAYEREKAIFDDVLARKREDNIKSVTLALVRASHELDPTGRLPLMGDEFWQAMGRAAVAAIRS